MKIWDGYKFDHRDPIGDCTHQLELDNIECDDLLTVKKSLIHDIWVRVYLEVGQRYDREVTGGK